MVGSQVGARARPRPARDGAQVTRRSEARRALLAWYRAERRDLPWRRTRDPYAIWVSETMLQQTRVEAVIPYYERFLARFPDVGALAGADLDDVLSLWAGLGYYSRARNLKRAAEQVVTRFAGRLPDGVDMLRELPGVGRYTAGAIASIAFDHPAPIVDGNVARVLARLVGLREPIESSAVKARLWEEAERLAEGPAPGDLNQALMELGARICIPRAPRCDQCPVSRFCDARAAGDAESLPVRAPKRAPKVKYAVAALVLRGGKALAVQRPEKGLLGGLWELPGGETPARRRGPATVAELLRARTGLAVGGIERLGDVEHVFTHRTMHLRVFSGTAATGRVRLDGWDRHRWLTPADFDQVPCGNLTKKVLALHGRRSR
jgi:A/G-specific adenine glycosylase